MAEVKVVWDGARMAELLRGPAGPVFKGLDKRADIFLPKARASAPIRTGCLRASIHKRPIEPSEGGLTLRIISDTTGCATNADGKATRTAYDYFIHEGTKAHTILPKKPGGVLAFTWHGRKVFYKKVEKKATEGRPYLRENMYVFTEPIT